MGRGVARVLGKMEIFARTRPPRALAGLLALALGLAPLPAAADLRGLGQMLREIPSDTVAETDGPLRISYGNADLLRPIVRRGARAGVNDAAPNRLSSIRSAPPAQAAALAAHEGEDLRRAIGLQHSDWVQSIEVAAGPVHLGIMRVFPDSEMRLRGALFSLGMQPEMRGDQMVFWRGDDHALSEDARDPANPFGGAEGRALRYAVMAGTAVWASGWPQMEALLSPRGGTLATLGPVAEMVQTLERATRRRGGVAAVDIVVSRDGTSVLEGAGVVVLGLALADVVDRTQEIAVLALHLGEGSDAALLAERLRAAWPGTMLAGLTADPEIDVAGSGGARPVLTLTVAGDWGADGATRNGALDALDSAVASGVIAAMLQP